MQKGNKQGKNLAARLFIIKNRITNGNKIAQKRKCEAFRKKTSRI